MTTHKLLALAAPALLLWSAPARADAPSAAPAPVVAAPAAAPGMIVMARILGALVAATQATAPMCDRDGRPMAGNVGKAMPDHTCSLGERFHRAVADELAAAP
jgi:hypothetical protein